MTCDWDKDDFMSKWDATYVATNLKPDATPYDGSFFIGLNDELQDKRPELKSFSYAIIAVASCAVGRADVVGRFFDDITINSTPDESQKIFVRLREALTIVFPFLGLPTCIPGCYGMIGVLERKGEAYGSTENLRKTTMDEENVRKGRELRAKIYSGVGNSGIFSLMDKYFTDLFNASTNFTWGYLISKANEEVFEMRQSHLVVAAAITALGVTRQTRSHIKASIGIGNSVDAVKDMVSMVSKIAIWAGRPFSTPDVDALAEQIKQALAN
ncbi:hypothetical protein BJ878DRAFT_583243 [Calycina marina]|uniref:Carboxymuconolactone decarboxylase-like domain-containing protein n=1 Tax=Calycina marina TaxID=1763456 RepID=A0A9P7Z173_9HELO|nr:hypothetical protein BJ878DRAFT_583243 [Calycina marina]